MRRETRHEGITLTALAVGIADMLQLVLGDLDEVNMLVTLKLCLVGGTIPSDLVNMVRANAQSTTVVGPEPDLLKRDAHQAWFPVLLRPVARVLKIMRTLHVVLGDRTRNWIMSKSKQIAGTLEPKLLPRGGLPTRTLMQRSSTTTTQDHSI